MKVTSPVAAIFACLVASIFQTAGAQAQTPCKPVDAIEAMASMNAEAAGASPEELAAFRAQSLQPSSTRIVGGQQTLIDDNPWQIAMIRAQVAEPTRSQFCGGSIVANDWILTAAHCVRNATVREDPARVDVIAGTSQYAIGGERLKVTAIHTHPNYNETTMDNDLALLRLQSPMTKGKVVEIAAAATQVPDDTLVCVTGWGATSEGGPGAIDLLGAEVLTVSTAVCNEPQSYNGDVLASMFCAGKREGGIDSCQGDSGGPVSAQLDGRTTLVGVVSWGEGCARRLKYGIYSRISAAAEWIAQTMGQQ